MGLSSLAIQFVLEGRDHCELAARGLLDLEKKSHDPEVINSIFRSFHTLKGTSGIFPEYAAITTLTHAAEDLMGLIRNGEKAIDSEMTDLFLAVLDQVGSWLDIVESTGAIPSGAQDESAPLITALKGMKDGSGAECVSKLELVTEVVEVNHLEPILRAWLISLDSSHKEFLATSSSDDVLTAFCYTPVPDAFFFGDDPISLIHTIPGLVLLDVVKQSEVPFDDGYDPFVCDLSFFAVATAVDEVIRDVFAYVEDQIVSLPFSPDLLEAVQTPATLNIPVGEPVSTLTEAEPEPAITAETSTKKTTYIRVNQEHINTLMNLVGEIIIAKNSLPYLGERASTIYGVPKLAEEIDLRHGTISNIVSGLQDIALEMRMLPASRVFERFPRLVRDISRKLDKKVSLVMVGEETLADKDVIDLLGDPLVHMVRNSLDHGVETPAERVAAGKPETAIITLQAFQDKSNIVVEVEDDGRGIDPARIRRKAIEKGVVSAETAAAMSDEEAVQLIMAPGFSTNDTVTDLSGRGVGMDVVLSMVNSLGGSVRAFSTPGQGSRMRLTLPMSMAISKILVVRLGECTYGIPADDVVESMVSVPLSRVTAGNTWPSLEVRGKLLPLYSLAAQLAIEEERAPKAGFSAVVVNVQGDIVALIVDSFQGISDVVVKPLASLLHNHLYYNGTTILGDGSITFILNMQEVIRNANQP
ncbi:MAG: chemotaxis protein CheA [Desulfobulbaceae bacterium]|nr:chemotaxis protein CheA [Desulfobulbaceae bacterium]